MWVRPEQHLKSPSEQCGGLVSYIERERASISLVTA